MVATLRVQDISGGLEPIRLAPCICLQPKEKHMPDYPTMIVPVDHIEPVPRRIRATLGGQTVLDTTHALYVWEWPNYPQYYIPIDDVHRELLVDEQHTQRLHRGTAHLHGLRVRDITRPSSARLYMEDAAEGLVGTACFEWEALDAPRSN